MSADRVDKMEKKIAQLKAELEKVPHTKIAELSQENRRLKAENKELEDKLSSMEEEISSKTFPIQESLNNAEASLRNQRKKIEDLQDLLRRHRLGMPSYFCLPRPSKE